MKRSIALSSFVALIVLAAAPSRAASAALLPPKPDDSYFEKFNPKPAPQPDGLVLKKGDRLAIIGDSITEQKMYSRYMEAYLTACVPELEVTVRQYGWGGETAPGFLARMTRTSATAIAKRRRPSCVPSKSTARAWCSARRVA